MSSLDTRAIDDKELRNVPAPAVHQGFRVFISEAAFDRAVARGDADTSREIGGVLVGQLLRDDSGPYLSITDTIDALHADEQGAEVTFTHATWTHIHEQMDKQFADSAVVGWYHTHPGFGIFLSDRDQFIHKSFFNVAHQVALVYDPKSKEHGVFVWRDNDIARARRYWIGAREQSWDGARGGEPKAGSSMTMRAAAPSNQAQPATAASARPPETTEDLPLPPTVWLAAGAVVCLLLGGVLGHMLFGGRGANQEELQRELMLAKEEGVKAAIAAVNSEAIAVLRDTLGDDAVHKPVAAAVKEIDGALAALDNKTGSGSAAVESGSGSGSGSGSAGAAGSPPVNIDGPILRLRAARDSLIRLTQDRASAAVVLTKLGRGVRGDPRELADQRAGLGGIYGELATDVARAGDLDRARRLIDTAIRLDPANRARYEKLLAGKPAPTAATKETPK